MRNVLPPQIQEWPTDERYRWMAQDLDGVWFTFASKPEIGVDEWCSNGPGGSLQLTAGRPNPNWRNTLISRDLEQH
ncbi:hypothetical protein D3C87_1946370 [compost metagenome]